MVFVPVNFLWSFSYPLHLSTHGCGIPSSMRDRRVSKMPHPFVILIYVFTFGICNLGSILFSQDIGFIKIFSNPLIEGEVSLFDTLIKILSICNRNKIPKARDIAKWLTVQKGRGRHGTYLLWVSSLQGCWDRIV